MGVLNYNALSTYDSSLPVTKYSQKLRRRAIPKDIYAPGVGAQGETILYKRQEMAIPSDIYTKIDSKDLGGTVTRVALKQEINANILRANTVAMGNEVTPVVRHGDLYRNNYRFVVQNTPGYGEHRLDAEWYNLYEEHVKELAPHAASEEGLEVRQAFVETFGWNLWVGSTAATCAPRWNPNFYVAGVPSIYNQPAFHPTNATYTNRIVAAIQSVAGAGFAQTAAQMLSCWIMDDIVRFALLRRLFPLMINGQQAFILTISPLQAVRFSNPRFIDTMGDRWIAQNRMNDSAAQKWVGLLGVFMSAAGINIYVVVDYRLPSLIPTGTAAPFGLTAGYMWPQTSDLRNLDNPLARDASILHGMGGVVNIEPEKLHFITQDWDYGVRLGKGYAGNRGIQQLQFDTTPVGATGATREYYGSAVIVLGRDNTAPSAATAGYP